MNCCVEDISDDVEKIFLDFSKLFYKYISMSLTIKQYNNYILEYFKKYQDSNVYIDVYVDKGFISQKIRERNIRLLQKEKTNLNELALIYLNITKELKNSTKEEDKEYKEETLKTKFDDLVKYLNIDIDNIIEKSKSTEFKYLKKYVILSKLFKIRSMETKSQIINENIQEISNRFNNIKIINCYNIDAEYQLAYDVCEYYKINNIDNTNCSKIMIDSDDQDVILLLLMNTFINFRINNTLFYNNILSRNISLITYIFNKSDYLHGIQNVLMDLENIKDKDSFINLFNIEYETIVHLLEAYCQKYKKNKEMKIFKIYHTLYDLDTMCKNMNNVHKYLLHAVLYYQFEIDDNKNFKFYEVNNILMEEKITLYDLFIFIHKYLY